MDPRWVLNWTCKQSNKITSTTIHIFSHTGWDRAEEALFTGQATI